MVHRPEKTWSPSNFHVSEGRRPTIGRIQIFPQTRDHTTNVLSNTYKIRQEILCAATTPPTTWAHLYIYICKYIKKMYSQKGTRLGPGHLWRCTVRQWKRKIVMEIERGDATNCPKSIVRTTAELDWTFSGHRNRLCGCARAQTVRRCDGGVPPPRDNVQTISAPQNEIKTMALTLPALGGFGNGFFGRSRPIVFGCETLCGKTKSLVLLTMVVRLRWICMTLLIWEC